MKQTVVSLYDFTGEAVKPWAVAGFDCVCFDIQHSIDGNPDSYRGWEILGFINGNGTTTETQHYTFIDEAPNNGINYYRLRQVDFNAVSEFSPIRVLEFNQKAAMIGEVFPNPVKDIAYLNINTTQQEKIEITIVDLTGKIIQNQVQYHNGTTQIELNLSKLQTGIYTAIIRVGGEQFVQKVMIID